MAKAINIKADGSREIEGEILAVLSIIGREECGSAKNAALVCIRESPRYRAALDRISIEEATKPKRRKSAE